MCGLIAVEVTMRKRILSSFFVVLVTLSVSAQWANPGSGSDSDVPAYNAAPPRKGQKLPALLPADQLMDPSLMPAQAKAYTLAAKIPDVIYQQPCYCYCDRSVGHNSLHSCFESKHGANCGTCLKEMYYSYDMHKKGKTARQIRQGIIKGEWKQVNLETAAAKD